jgi:hypothetical protein
MNKRSDSVLSAFLLLLSVFSFVSVMNISAAQGQNVIVSEIRIKDEIGNPVFARVEFISFTDQAKIHRALETDSNGVAVANQDCDPDYRIRVAPRPNIYIPIGLQRCQTVVEIPARLPQTVKAFLRKGEEAYSRKDYGVAILFASQAAEMSRSSDSLRSEYLLARQLGINSTAKEFPTFDSSFQQTDQGIVIRSKFKSELSDWQKQNYLTPTGELDFQTQAQLFKKYSPVPAGSAIQSVIMETYALQPNRLGPRN